uniref:Uncharacterized protein n=1 Tax=viral metagenome TaxID=1070528 RepID=A0A6C0DM26_9ZZZZ
MKKTNRIYYREQSMEELTNTLYNTKVILFLLLAMFTYFLCSVYFIGYAYNKAFIVYNKKLDLIYERIVEKNNHEYDEEHSSK